MDELFPVDKQLDIWLAEKNIKLFPMGSDYISRYKQVSDYLIKNVHSEVEKGAIINQLKENDVPWDQIIYLNNHGPGHVEHVIKQASKLLKISKCKLSPYEGYLLLMAIHLHDVGIIYGREEHTKKCMRILTDLGSVAGTDHPEKKAIAEIASAHAGCSNGNDKDTIGKLEDTPILGKPVRKRILAAILRLADELADDRSRASRFMLENGELPAHSEIYHAYSYCLHSTTIDIHQINLSFDIEKSSAMKQYVNGNGTVYLLDNIYDRTLKMHTERVYCMRFLRPSIEITGISVKIEISADMGQDYIIEPLEKINYHLEDKGYPDNPEHGICGLCKDLEGKNGSWLKNKLKEIETEKNGVL